MLGCAGSSVAVSNLTARAEAPGYISVRWEPPRVRIAGGQDWVLEGRFYLLRVSHDEMEEETVVLHNTSDHSLVLASPLWGSLYGAGLTCWQGGLSLACGSLSLVATPEVSPACRAHSSFCREEEQVLFLSPAHLVATTLANSSVEVVWRDSEGGWRAPARQVLLEDEAMPGRELLRQEVGEGGGSVVLPGLQEDRTYTLRFLPSGPRVPPDIGQVAASLALLPGALSFLASLQLRTHVLWAGKLRASWVPAVARGAGGRRRGRSATSWC